MHPVQVINNSRHVNIIAVCLSDGRIRSCDRRACSISRVLRSFIPNPDILSNWSCLVPPPETRRRDTRPHHPPPELFIITPLFPIVLSLSYFCVWLAAGSAKSHSAFSFISAFSFLSANRMFSAGSNAVLLAVVKVRRSGAQPPCFGLNSPSPCCSIITDWC